MQYLEAIILGLVQGLTEFLPVSSSGHLAIVGSFLKLNQPGVLFETVLHAGTALAVIWYLREKLFKLTFQELILLGIATVPAGIVGVLFNDQVEGLFSILKLVGVAFLITAFLNFRTDKQEGRREHMDALDAVVIGVMQAFAIVPGISRSGATIFAGTKMNLSKTRAAEFSFLLSIPAILGANVVEFMKHGGDGSFSIQLGLLGFVAAFFSGLFAIKFLMRMLTEKKLKYFSFYLVIIGVITILFL